MEAFEHSVPEWCSRELSAPNLKLMATAMPLASAQDLYDNLMQHSVTEDMLKGREDEHWAPLLLPGGFRQVWRYALQKEIKGRGLDGIVVGLDGDMVVKVNQLHPKELKKCEAEECRRSMEAESKERFKKEVDYLLKHQNWRFVVPILPVVYVMGENSQLLGYLMPELKSLEKFPPKYYCLYWYGEDKSAGDVPPSESMALQVLRQLISILLFFRKSEVVYSDLKPQNILLRELPGGRLVVKLNDFGFVGPVGGEFQGGTDKYLPPPWAHPWDWEPPPLDYEIDTYAAHGIVLDIYALWGHTILFEPPFEVVKFKFTRLVFEQEIHGLEPNEVDIAREVFRTTHGKIYYGLRRR